MSVLHGDALGLLLGAVRDGARPRLAGCSHVRAGPANRWLAGFAASVILGVGHLLSSIPTVGLF